MPGEPEAMQRLALIAVCAMPAPAAGLVLQRPNSSDNGAEGIRKCRVCPWDGVDMRLAKQRGFHPQHVLDIGANEGDWTRYHYTIFPEAEFLMVEACGEYEKDWTDLLASGNVTGYSAMLDGGAAGKAKRADLLASGNATGLWAVPDGGVAKRSRGAWCTVPKSTTTVDQLLETAGKSNVAWDLVKLDVENMELEVLAGAKETLKKVEVIQTEVAFAGSYKVTFAEYVAYFDDLGFAPFGMPEQHRSPMWGGNLAQIDILYVRKGSKIMRDLSAPR